MPVCRAIAIYAALPWIAVALAGSALAESPPLVSAERESQFQEKISPFIAQFCGDCHSGAKAEKGLRLSDFHSAQSIADARSTWKKVIDKLRSRTMPPKDAPKPSAEQYDAVVQLLTDTLAEAAHNTPHDPGRVTMRRLNRAEYNNTLRDLLSIDFHPADDFPADDVGYGFDNNGDVLSLPPVLLEKYLAAAEKAVRMFLARSGATAGLSSSADPREMIHYLADRAFRRPIDEETLDRLMKLFSATDHPDQPLSQRLQPVLTAILVSPQFLFRAELDPPPGDPQTPRQLDDWELASRLSYFLWSSMPDDELFDLARRGQLRDQLQPQVHRMLHDPKAHALAENFADQWLQTRQLENIFPDTKQFPQWNPQLRAAMRTEALSLFSYVMSEDLSLLEFIDAPYTFLNAQLAEFYGIEGVQGTEFRRVDLPAGSPRGGVITLAGVLSVTSNPDRTSPVKRGKWILENILGTPPPPQPPDVPELSDRHNGKSLGTVRQQMEQHRHDARCAGCHLQMDPLGFGLENFDAIGAWRDHEAPAPAREHSETNKTTAETLPIDSSGILPDGRKFNGPVELKKILLDQRALFCRAFSQKMLTYALGRGTTESDDALLDNIADAVAQDDYKFSRLVWEIVTSEPFQMRRGASTP